MSHSRRSPRPLGLALDGAQKSWAPESLLGEIQSVWSGVVGPAIAAEATPVSERGGVLTVACTGSVWAQELDLLAPSIIGRLNGAVRLGRVARLRCVTTPVDSRR
jgi:hypothetical protein